MDEPQVPLERATQMVHSVSSQTRRMRRIARKRNVGARIVRSMLWMLFSTFVIIPGMIAGGFLFGPRGVEGLIAAPAVLFSLYALILYWYFGRKPKAIAPEATTLAQLPAQTGEWLDLERDKLPPVAQDKLEALQDRLDALIPQLQALDAHAPAGHELRRLLGEELPELVRIYSKVPVAFRQKPLYEGKTPEQQLMDGLDTITQQIDQAHSRLAVDDLHALATHQHYLDLKYNRKSKID